MNKLKRIILDAMLPEFKAANAELLKAIKMNDKSDALPYSDLEAINKAMKSNDGDKVGSGLKKVQLKIKDAEKKLNEDLKDVTQRFSGAQKDIDSVKEKSKQIKSVQQLFDKSKTLVDSLKTSPKSASKLTSITERLKQYGDLSGKAQKAVRLISSGKDASKQIDVLEKAVSAAEKKFKKESSAFDKEFNKSRDSYIVLKERLKICKDKLSAFQKERLYVANVVKMMPQGDLRQKGSQKTDYNDLASKLFEQYSSLVDAAKKEVNKIVQLYKKQSFNYDSYSKQAKKEIWGAYETVASKHPAIAQILKGAYKYSSFKDISSLISEVVKSKNEIKGAGDDPKKYLGALIGFIKESKEKYEGSGSYPDGISANDASMINFHAEKNIDDAIGYLFDYVEPYKSKSAKLFNEYKDLWEKAKSEKVKIPRSLSRFK